MAPNHPEMQYGQIFCIQLMSLTTLHLLKSTPSNPPFPSFFCIPAHFTNLVYKSLSLFILQHVFETPLSKACRGSILCGSHFYPCTMRKNSFSFSRITQSFRNHRSRSSPVQTPSEERHHGASSAPSPTSSDVAIPRTLSLSSSTDSQDSLDIHTDDLWKMAFEQVSVEEKELVQAYNEILNQATGIQ